MDAPGKAAISYIAARYVAQRPASSVYDYSSSSYLSFSGDVSQETVNVYDYTSKCYIVGKLTKGHPMLYHYGKSNYIQLSFDGPRFKGYDYASRAYFQGIVKGQNIDFYDYADGRYYSYFVS